MGELGAAMSKKAVRVIATVVILGGALTAMMYRTLQSDASFYKHVDEVMVSPQQWYGKSLKLHGFVQAGSITWKPDTLDYRFVVKTGEHSVLASYHGLVPDTFKDDAEVVMDGRLSADGFHASSVVAKCPSRYEAGKGADATKSAGQ
jgi:cytochrome c-type biogenesis protein CcmE